MRCFGTGNGRILTTSPGGIKVAVDKFDSKGAAL
jgi:hypothetical protein